MKKKTPRFPIALKLPHIVALLIVFGRRIVQAMTNNKWFGPPNPPTPPLATVTTDLDALEVAEAKVRSGAKDAAAARDVLKKTVEDDLKGLKTYVYGIGALDALNAITIILSAGMEPMQFTRRTKPMFEALMGAAPQEVIVRAKAVGRRVSYEWQYSSDDGKTWLGMGTTTVADTSIQGLTVGATYLFRFRTTVKRTTGDWSHEISFTVH